MSLKTRRPVPDLAVATLGGSRWDLAEQRPENFSLVVFYRGVHCPKCRTSLADLNRREADFAEIGVSVIVVSCDDEDRAMAAKNDWGLDNLNIGYGLTIDKAREWGLYISTSNGVTSIGKEEPVLFCEPGLFVIQPGGNLYMTAVQSMPFARAHFEEVLQGVRFVIETGYPARGEA